MKRRVLPSCRLEAALSNHLFPRLPYNGQYEISVGSDKISFDFVEDYKSIDFFKQLFENEKQSESKDTETDSLNFENKCNYYFEHTPATNMSQNILPTLDQIETMVMSRGRRKKSEMDSTGRIHANIRKKSPDSTKLRRNSKKFETSGSEAEDSDVDTKASQAYFDSEDSNEDVENQHKKKAKRMIKRRKKEKDDSQSDVSDREKITIIKNRTKIFEFIQANIIDWSAKQEKSFPGMKKKMLDNFFQGSSDTQISPSDSKLSIKVEDSTISSPALKSDTGSNEPSPTDYGSKKRRSLKLKKKENTDDEEQHAPEGNISDFNFLNSLTSPTGGSSTVGEPDPASSNTNSIMSLKIPRKKKQPATIVSENATTDHSNSNSLLDNSPISNTPSSTLPPSAATPHSATGITPSASFASPTVVSSLAPPPPPQQPPPPLLPPASNNPMNASSILLPQSSQQQGAPSFMPPNANILPNVYGSSSSTSTSNYPTLHPQQSLSYHMHPHQSTHNLPPPPPPHAYPSHQSLGSLPPYGAATHGQSWQPHLPYINPQQQQQQPQPPSYPPVQDPRRR